MGGDCMEEYVDGSGMGGGIMEEYVDGSGMGGDCMEECVDGITGMFAIFCVLMRGSGGGFGSARATDC